MSVSPGENPTTEKEILDEPPPVLGSWLNVYRFVLAYIAILIFLFWLFTKHFAPDS